MAAAGSTLKLDGSYTTKVLLPVLMYTIIIVYFYCCQLPVYSALGRLLSIISWTGSFLFLSELPANHFGKITSIGKKFQWNSHSASCKVAGTYWIYTISGIVLSSTVNRIIDICSWKLTFRQRKGWCKIYHNFIFCTTQHVMKEGWDIFPLKRINQKRTETLFCLHCSSLSVIQLWA